jgi:hypothetical protein
VWEGRAPGSWQDPGCLAVMNKYYSAYDLLPGDCGRYGKRDWARKGAVRSAMLASPAGQPGSDCRGGCESR